MRVAPTMLELHLLPWTPQGDDWDGLKQPWTLQCTVRIPCKNKGPCCVCTDLSIVESVQTVPGGPTIFGL